MTKNFARFERGERVDQPDLEQVAELSPLDMIAQLGAEFLIGHDRTGGTQPNGFILKGFAVDEPTANVVRVTKDVNGEAGAAILSFRDRGVVRDGLVLSGGPASQQRSIATFPAGTYQVWIRFDFVDSEFENRAFWDPNAVVPAEFPHSIPTRRAETWSMTVEAASPGPEWLHIAQVNNPLTSINDRRQFYFEGTGPNFDVNDAEWGGVDDRSSLRATNGVFGLRRFVRAVQRQIQDIIFGTTWPSLGGGWFSTVGFGLADKLNSNGVQSITGILRPDGNATRDFGTVGLRFLTMFANVFNGLVLLAQDHVEIVGFGPATVGPEARIYGNTIIQAWAHMRTDGLGTASFDVAREFGMTVSMPGTNLIRLTFDFTFNSVDEFAVIGMGSNGNSGFNFIENSRTATTIDLVPNGGTPNFSTEVYRMNFIVTGTKL